MTDAQAQRPRMARQYHEAAARTSHEAETHRRLRDEIIRALRAEDPGYWTYAKLAEEIGCSKELIALIINPKKVKP